MKILVKGGGWYGCHLSRALLRAGHEVELHEKAAYLFAGASGGNPARLHLGFHYPRSRLTRAACQEHYAAFMAEYGHLTRTVPVNVYAVAALDSLVDFGTYLQVLRGEIEYVRVERPAELGLESVEGAVLTGERHIVIDEARAFFEKELTGAVHFGSRGEGSADWTIDCTFCALDGESIDRYEPCITVLLEGPTDKAVTIMDGPFPSLYPWNEAKGLSSLTSAKYTPFSKTCRTWGEANSVLSSLGADQIETRCAVMVGQMAKFYPEVCGYRIAGHKLTIRAMPRSGADARLVDIVRTGDRALRVRAGKIDAILHAEEVVKAMLC